MKIRCQNRIIREANLDDAHNIALVHFVAWKQSYKGIIDQKYLDNISFEHRLELRKNILSKRKLTSLHLVALYQDQIIGFCDAGSTYNKNTIYKGEIYAIYILEEFKKLGIGRQLFKIAHHFLTHRNLTPYCAWVLQDNQCACAFYRNNGGIPYGKKVEQVGDKLYKEVSYIF